MSRSLVMIVCKKDTRGASPVKYEVFDFYAKIAASIGETDWHSFFQILSRGNSQKGMKFNGRTLSIKSGNSIKVYEVCIPEIMEIDEATKEDFNNFYECQNFIKENTAFFSTEESKQPSQELNETYEGVENKFKLGIVNQTTHIEKFARRKCKEFNLDINTRESLISTINALFASKHLTSKSVMQNLSDGEINTINGIEIDNSGFRINVSKLFNPKTTEPAPKRKQLTFGSSNALSKVEQKMNKNR